ncbi:MAG TPA: hydrogenase expression/formation protein HypE [Candidatus Omnitrophica bacterium]|nr:MAG: hydrogenase expression/formation protein HypE [Omnitrophica WOR_2 bacterium GWF2_63_9]HAM41358.1 hydrogenase expression/formation protein HypE [Candidatus Omnitrophota bacterium]HBH96318.1 hydrogenase expression/formation protein HypE [Candidatus Omnitrophota bacterium]HBQ37575.1 hydrogenase expression/formation protein HypE [Candidatus Omnitrophota bacterium]
MSVGSPHELSCPVPILDGVEVLLAHGGGGRLSHQLIERMFRPAFQNDALNQRHDGAVVGLDGHRLAFTTDSYVVHPLIFPGGDIGQLAVNGTVNDLAMCGAKPLWLSVGLILEEGLPMTTLQRIVGSMRQAAQAAGVEVVTGDTKVVDRGKGDGLFINTAGIGLVEPGVSIGPSQVQPGDGIILSGDLGRHGIAIMAVREGLAFESTIASDTAPLSPAVQALMEARCAIHCLRDLTRGGLSSALVEIAQAGGRSMAIEERLIPVDEEVRGACEVLGLDPLYVANEGRFVAFVAPQDASRAVEILRRHPVGRDAVLIGRVTDVPDAVVTMESVLGVPRLVEMLSGEQLPRIC